MVSLSKNIWDITSMPRWMALVQEVRSPRRFWLPSTQRISSNAITSLLWLTTLMTKKYRGMWWRIFWRSLNCVRYSFCVRSLKCDAKWMLTSWWNLYYFQFPTGLLPGQNISDCGRYALFNMGVKVQHEDEKYLTKIGRPTKDNIQDFKEYPIVKYAAQANYSEDLNYFIFYTRNLARFSICWQVLHTFQFFMNYNELQYTIMHVHLEWSKWS